MQDENLTSPTNYNCRPGSSSGKALDYGLDGLGSIPGVRGVEISLLRVQTGPGVHSASYKMSTERLSPRVKAAECKTSHPPYLFLVLRL